MWNVFCFFLLKYQCANRTRVQNQQEPDPISHFLGVQLHFLIKAFPGIEHKQVRNQRNLIPNCTNTCRFPAKFVTHFLNAFHSVSGCDIQNFSSLFLICRPKLQQQCGDKAHFIISVPQGHQKLFLQPRFWGKFWEKLSLLSLSF